MSQSSDDPQCIPGINWLRALLSVAVVAWHMGSFGKSFLFDEREYAHHVFTLSDLINFQVLLLAVPTFFLISCYLYARKKRDLHYGKDRVVRFALLAAFWTVAAVTWVSGYHGLLSLRPASLQSFMLLALSAGDTPYYFFVSLIIVTVVTHLFSRAPTTLNVILFILASALVFVLPEITITYSLSHLSAFWNPLNFLPYPFAAIVLARNDRLLADRNARLLVIAGLLVAAILLGFYEWRFYVHEIFFRGQPYAIPAYMRLSVVCSSLLLFSIGLTRGIRTNRVIDFMAKRSLSLYCLHPFFIVLVNEFFPLAGLPRSPFLIEMVKLTLLLVACYTTSLLFNKAV